MFCLVASAANGQTDQPRSSAETILLQQPVVTELDTESEPAFERERWLERRIRRDAGTDQWRQSSTRDSVYHPWSWSVSYLSGYLGLNLGPRTAVPFDMVPQILRLNCIWNSPRPNRLFKGSFEGIIELDTMPVVRGPADIVIGGSLLLRYNYQTHKDRRWVLYLQGGGGGMYTDAYLHGSPVLTTGFEFIVQWGAGMNIFLNRRLALTTEFSFFHFSNGGIVLPNISVNQAGFLIGLTYYFGRK